MEQSVHFEFPLLFQFGCLSRVVRAYTEVGQRRRQLLESHARVGHKRNRRDLVGIELGGVDIDETHRWILEGRH